MKSFRQFVVEGNPLARLHKHIASGRHFVVLSAQRGSDEASASENKKRHAELKKKLTAQGYGHKEVEGHWEGGKEKSIIVHAKKEGDEAGHQLVHDMKQHAHHYNQDSIFHHDGKEGKLHGTNATGYPGKGKTEPVGKVHYNQPKEPFQTELKPKGDKLKAGRTSKGSARFTTK
jgi:hypothetical protein